MGTALSVERTYFAGQFALGEGVTLAYLLSALQANVLCSALTFGGSITGGGGRSSSATLKG